MTAPIFLISCTKTKAPAACAAGDLYQSDWFRKARAYVEAKGGRWFILSAEHGLVDPEAIVAPYETTLCRMRKPARRAWAVRVYDQLLEHGLTCSGPVVILAGELYRENLERWLNSGGRNPRCSVPMRGLGLGQQKAWLAAHTPAEA